MRDLKRFFGAEAKFNIVFITTIWSWVSHSVAENREAELCGTVWAEMLADGATYSRFGDTTESAWDIITPLLDAEPAVLMSSTPGPQTQAESSAAKPRRILKNVATDALRFAFGRQ